MGPGTVIDENEVIRLPNPPTKKWVTFQDWDEEALEYRATSADEYQSSSGDEATHIRSNNSSEYRPTPGRFMQLSSSGISTSQLSSSVSSDSSFGSCGEGNKYEANRRKSTQVDVRDFNASFGGTDRQGGAAGQRTMWQNVPNKKYDLQARRLSGPSYFSEELENINFSSSSVQLSTSKYAAFDELRTMQNYGAAQGSAPTQLGWSRDVLGEEEKERRQNKVSGFIF